MSTTVTRIKKDGKLLLKDTINERLPVVTNGLVAHYPLDGDYNNSNPDVYVPYLNYTVNTIDQRTITYAANSPFIFTCTFKPAWDCADDKYIISLQNGDIAGNVFNFGVYQGKLLTWTITPDTGVVISQGVSYKLKLDYDGTALKIYLDGTLVNSRAVSIGVATYIRVGEYHNSATTDSWIGELWDWSFTQKYSPTNNSNTVQTPDGLAIQLATTNLVTDINPAWGPWSGFTGSSQSYLAPNGSQGVVLNAITGGGTMWRYTNGGAWITVLPSTTYTVSAYIKATNITGVSTNCFYIYQYTTGLTYVAEYGVFSATNARLLPNGYYFCWGTFTTTATTGNIQLQGFEYSGGQQISCYNLQLEQNAFATAYVNGSASSGLLSIPNPVRTGQYTISFKCSIPSTVGTLVGYNTIMSMGGYYTTNSWTIMDQSYPTVAGLQTLIRKGAADEWAWQSGNMSNPSNFHDKNVYTIVRNASDYLCYFNGIYTGSVAHLSTTMQDTIWVGSRDWGSTLGASVVSDLSIYNRALTASEVTALVGESFKVSTTSATTLYLNESPVIPVDGYYFPLASDTKDISKTIDATDNANTVFEDGAAWVGTSNTNISTYSSDLTNGWNYSNATIASTSNASPIDSNKSSYLINFTAASFDMYRTYTGLTAGASYTVSMYVKLGTATNFCIVVNNTADWNVGASKEFTSVDGLNTKRYTRVSLTFTCPATGQINLHLGGHAAVAIPQQTAGNVYIYGHQLEQKMFLTPYMPSLPSSGTRGATSLEYNLNSTIGLDWSGNWSICYWKKPIATNGDNLTNYNIDSLGCNSNSVGGGYVWWGKEAGSNVVYASTPSAFTTSDYFNNWQFITIIKSGTVVTIKTQLVTGTIYVRTFTGPTTANSYVTQYGYDLKLGGYDNTSPPNVYFRDLIVARRALSDTEVQNIYKQFSIYKTKVNTQNLIEEGI